MKISEITIRYDNYFWKWVEKGGEDSWLCWLLTLSSPGNSSVMCVAHQLWNLGTQAALLTGSISQGTQELMGKLLLSKSHEHVHNFHSCTLSHCCRGSESKPETSGSEQSSFPSLSAGSDSHLRMPWLWFSFPSMSGYHNQPWILLYSVFLYSFPY